MIPPPALIIGPGTIDRSEELPLQSCVQGTCNSLEDSPGAVNNVDVCHATFILEAFDDRAIPIKHHRVGKTLSEERTNHRMERLGNHGDIGHAIDIYLRSITFIESLNPRLKLLGARAIGDRHRGDLLLGKAVSAKKRNSDQSAQNRLIA